jgi:hypothetical protein
VTGNYKLKLSADKKTDYKILSFIHEIDIEEGINEKIFTDTRISLSFLKNNTVQFKENKEVKVNGFFDKLDEVIRNEYLFGLSDDGRIIKLKNRAEILERIKKEKIKLLAYDPRNASKNLEAVLFYEELFELEKAHLLFEFNGITNSMFMPFYNKSLEKSKIKVTIGDLIPTQYIPVELTTEVTELKNNSFLLKVSGTLDEEIIGKNKFYAHLREIYQIPMYEQLNLVLGVSGYYVFKRGNPHYESFLLKKTMKENYNLKEYIDYGYKI